MRGAVSRAASLAGRLSRWLHDAGAELGRDCIDGVWPARCWLCGAALERRADRSTFESACDEHALGQTLTGSRCCRCASTLAPGLAHGTLCRACRVRPPAFRAVHAASDYAEASVRSWLLAFKHGGRFDLATPLAAYVADSVARTRTGGRVQGGRVHGVVAGLERRLLVPVPLHPVRLIERGYDQASLLARHIAGPSLGPSVPLLRRVRPTPAQGSELAPHRRLNVQGAFRCRVRIPPGTSVLLVDDVIASGATADACARALRRAGAADVRVLVVARA